MPLNLEPGFDADLDLAHRALERGWVTREHIECAILTQEKTPGSRLLSHLPLTPDQLAQLKSPAPAVVPPEIAAAANDPARRVEHYILGDFLHSGGMGRVHKAWDLKLSRWVALKFMKGVGDARSEAYFEREARLAAGLSHPNIAAIYESGQSAGERYIAMQLIPGTTLEKVRRTKIPELVRLVRDAARAVSHANAGGVIHRDIKPSNLMVSPDGRIYVLDFGLARPVQGEARHSATGKAMGTPAYMSPEQARGAAVDARSDVYGLGATLYECLTGRPPFRGATIYDVLRQVEESTPPWLRRINPRVPADLETIVLKCLEKEPSRRYDTADALADDLDRFLNHDAIQARPASAFYWARRGLAKRKALVLASLASTFLAAALGWWLLVGRPGSEHLRLRESAMKLWAEARGTAMAGVDRPAILRQAKEARVAFEHAIQAQESPEAHLMRGRCLELEHRPDEAFKALERAHELDPANVEVRLELAKALLTEYAVSRGFPQEYSGIQNDKVKAAGGTLAVGDESPEQRRRRERAEKLLTAGGTTPAQASLLAGLLAVGKGEHGPAAEALATYTRIESWDAPSILLEGICLYWARDFPGALAALDRSIARVPECVAFHWRGRVKARGGSHEEAIADYTKALDDHPEYPEVYNSRALSKASRGLHDDAIADFTKAIELNPRDAGYWTNRGSSRGLLGRWEDAVADHTKAIELRPSFAGAYINRGATKRDRGLVDEAIADFKKATELDPTWAEAFWNLGSAHADKGLMNEAVADFTRALALEPGNARARVDRGLAMVKMGRMEEAWDDFKKVLEIDPKHPQAWFLRGKIHHAKEMWREAVDDYSRTLDADPGHTEALISRGLAMYHLGRHDDSIVDYTRAIELNARLHRAWYNRGLAYTMKRKTNEAIADYTRAIELNPMHAQSYSNRGYEKLAKGLPDEAYEDFTKAIEVDPKFPDGWLNRGAVKVAQGKASEAAEDWKKALEVAPPNWPRRATVERDLANIQAFGRFREAGRLAESKRYQEAIEVFKEIVETYPRSREALPSAYNTACSYALLGDKSNALEWLERAVEMGWKDGDHIQNDADLESLRTEERFKKVVDGLKKE